MLKVVVFDTGWGGELFADYLSQSLNMIEITRVIDWEWIQCADKKRSEICARMEACLEPYIGEADLIVVASYAATVAGLNYLKRRWPMQKFIGFDPHLSHLLPRGPVRRVMTVALERVRQSRGYEKDTLGLELAGMKLIEPECEHWLKWADDGELTADLLRLDLEYQAKERGMDGQDLSGKWHIDAVLIYCTGLVDFKKELEEVLGHQVVILDDFRGVLREVCAQLKLRGVDGERYIRK